MLLSWHCFKKLISRKPSNVSYWNFQWKWSLWWPFDLWALFVCCCFYANDQYANKKIHVIQSLYSLERTGKENGTSTAGLVSLWCAQLFLQIWCGEHTNLLYSEYLLVPRKCLVKRKTKDTVQKTCAEASTVYKCTWRENWRTWNSNNWLVKILGSRSGSAVVCVMQEYLAWYFSCIN